MRTKRFRKKLSILMVVMFLFNMGYVPPSFAAGEINGTINFTGIDGATTTPNAAFTDGQTVNDINATDIAGIDIDMYGSSLDQTTKIGLFKYVDSQRCIFLDDAPSYTYAYLIIESRDGKDFSLNSIYINNYYKDQELVSVEGFRNGASTGTSILNLDAEGMPTQFTQSTGLIPSVFQNIDKIAIKSITPNSLDDVTVGIGGINIGDPIIPLNTPPLLTADTTANSVDHDLEIEIQPIDDSTYRNAITAVTYNGNTLDFSQYDITQSGKIILKPSVSGNTYLRTPGTENVVIAATGYSDATVSQTIDAVEVASLEVTTQPLPSAVSGDAFGTQPMVNLKDQYGNYCTTGISNNANVIATAKAVTGSWTIGGTTTKEASAGSATFIDLTATRLTSGKGAITFATGVFTVDSSEFEIPLNVGKTLTADTTANSVDNDLEITFTEDPSYRAAITAVRYNGNTLTSSQYDITQSGIIILHPSCSDNTFLRTSGTANVVITATGYNDSTIMQTIDAGAVASLEVSTQPLPDAKSGDLFKTQPVVKLKDQYNNYCTTGVSVGDEIAASAKNGTGSWTIGGTVLKSAVNGVATFDNLSATLVGAGTGMIKFESSGIEADSAEFTIPAKATSGGGSTGGGSTGGGSTGGGGGGTTPTPTNPTTPPGTKTGEKNVPVIINGKVENAGTETITQSNGVKTVDMSVSGELVNKKIEEAVKQQAQTPNEIVNNVVEVPISTTDANSINTKLTGDVVKMMGDNSFKLMINASNVDYTIPANELKIENVAAQMGVLQTELKNIEVQIKIDKVTEEVSKQISENAAKKNMAVVVNPVEFSIVANTVSKDGTRSEVIISKFTQYVERVIEIPDGVDTSKITTGVVYNDDGSFAHIPTEIVTKDSKYYAKLNSPTNSKYTIIWNPVKVASVKNHWSKESVEDMASRLVIDNPNSFEPNRAITRGEFIDVVTKGLGIYRPQTEADNKFNDVNKANKYYNGVLTGVDYGLINGYKDGSFKPNQKITREEAMAIYAKAMDIAKLEASNTSKLKAYKDSSKISPWAYNSVDKVVASGIFSGRSASQISPKDNITCAEAVVEIL